MGKSFKILPDIAGVYCFFVFGALVLFAGERALLDGDTLWHIKLGTVMLERGEILTRDIFSHTVYGQPWTSHEWLAEIIMGALHQAAGLAGVVIFYFLLVAFTLWILFKIVNTDGTEWLSLFCVSVALVLLMTHLLARPHIFSWLFGAITLYLLQKGGRRLFFLPVLMILWTNLHGGFVLGLVLQGIFIAGSALEQWSSTAHFGWKNIIKDYKLPIVVLLLSVLAVGINPFGYQLLLFPFHVSKGIFSTAIGEWKAPDLQVLWYFRLYILFIVLLLFFHGSKINWTSRLTLLLFLNAALTHVRHVSLAGIFLTPFIHESLSPWSQRFLFWRGRNRGGKELSLSRASGPIATLFLGFFLLVLCTTEWPSWENVTERLFPLPVRFSADAIRYLKEHPPEGKMFNQDEWGDYLIYAMDSPPKVFIDGRLDMYGEQIVGDYMKMRDIREEADDLLKGYNIDWVLFPTSQTLIRYLMGKGDWEEVYRDDQATILVRKNLHIR